MPTIQFLAEAGIKELKHQHGVMAMITSGKLIRTEKDRKPAKTLPGGDSIIYNFHDVNGRYVATAHKLLSPGGTSVHCDVKRFVFGTADYRIPKKPYPLR